jgi:PmbA protein
MAAARRSKSRSARKKSAGKRAAKRKKKPAKQAKRAAKRKPAAKSAKRKAAGRSPKRAAKPAAKPRATAKPTRAKPGTAPKPAPRRLRAQRHLVHRELGRRAGPEREKARHQPQARPLPGKIKAKLARPRSAAAPSPGEDSNLVEDLVRRACKAGADAADAVLVRSAALTQSLRLGKPEKLERAEAQDLGLRVFVGKRQAIVSASDLAAGTRAELVERAVAMARSVPEDPHAGLAEPALLARSWPGLDMADPTEPDPAWLLATATAAEEAARAVQGVTNSEGAEASWSRSQVTLAASNGFVGGYERSYFGLSVSVLAGSGTAMERDDDFTAGVYRGDLEDPALVGRRAGERAVRRLDPRKTATRKLPVVYDPRVSSSLLGHLAGAINGAAIARGTSFLKDKMGAGILPKGVNVIDDPHRRRGFRSRPFDGEGIGGERRALVEDGVLKSWVLDLRSGRQLGLASTGHAQRHTSSPPAPGTTNLYLEPGARSPEALVRDIGEGFYITDLMGFGVNGVTGDYSRGASGFWIERGELAYPVSEVTVAGNLKEMFRNLTAADDLKFRYGTDAPTLAIEGMTIAGK